MVGTIFLNYRRSDAEAWADRLYERLTEHFARDQVFMDIDGQVPLGLPWADWLDSKVSACDLMLVLIGRSWVAEFDSRNGPNDRDYVRVEIESALARDIPVVPIFLGDTPIPSADNLPPSIRPLLGLQATRLERLTFEQDATRLIEGVVRSIELSRATAAQVPGPTQKQQPPSAEQKSGRPDGRPSEKTAKVNYQKPRLPSKQDGGTSKQPLKAQQSIPSIVFLVAGAMVLVMIVLMGIAFSTAY